MINDILLNVVFAGWSNIIICADLAILAMATPLLQARAKAAVELLPRGHGTALWTTYALRAIHDCYLLACLLPVVPLLRTSKCKFCLPRINLALSKPVNGPRELRAHRAELRQGGIALGTRFEKRSSAFPLPASTT